MTSKHATNTRDIERTFDYTKTGNKTAPAGNRGLATTTKA